MAQIPAYICLGSNSANAEDMLAVALDKLRQLRDCEIASVSSVYFTEPQEIKSQPWFVNRVVQLMVPANTDPPEFMRTLLALEAGLGRVRQGPRHGPRTIDIDLLLLGEIVSSDPVCVLPHPRLKDRAFALVPLIEIAPAIVLEGRPARAWLDALPWRREGNKIFQ